MGVPKRKRSRQRRDKRFANKGIKVAQMATCQQCQAPLTGHQACETCGYYKGVKVLVTKLERAVKRGKTRQAQMARQKMAETAQTPGTEAEKAA